ncbi:DUF6777 domain-containing protein [Streptomyces avermitilis]|uniref:DUF6777 domain-containing protein n=1 Tax=Streptomyces avermitilis TaxID=33903 RepID=UPI0033A91115
MSVEPPDGRPTGPPSGPLSGPTQQRPVQPSGGRPARSPSGGDAGSGGSAGSGGGGGPSGPRGPRGPDDAGKGPERWWKSVPRVALMATAVVVAVVTALVFTRSQDTSTASKGGELFLQAAGKSGPYPFTESTANDSSTAPLTPAPASTSASAQAALGIVGSAPGLYGGTRKVSSCDVEKQVKALEADPGKKRAFAAVEGIEASEVPAYLRSLTPLQLSVDTRVTNHGFRNGDATPYQAVLQAGTAVLVDRYGVPRVRCACGNPLLRPVRQTTVPRQTGDTWASFRPENVVFVTPASTAIDVFVIFDPDHDEWFHRQRGDQGRHDKKTDPPRHRPSPSLSASTLPPDSSSPAPHSPSSKPPGPSTSSPSAPSSPDSSRESSPESSRESSSESSSESHSESSSEPPTTESPATESPATEPRTTEPSTTEPSTTEPPTTESSSPSVVPPETTTEPDTTYTAPEPAATPPAY